MKRRIQWPQDRDFAFTIVDDTDFVTLDRVREVYAFLEELGLRTTKTVWPLRGDGEPMYGGSTCEDAEYRSWVLGLQQRGFEIAMHNAAPCTSTRETTLRGFDRFVEIFGSDPRTFINHAGCKENMYWGDARLTGFRRYAYNILHRNRRKEAFGGHVVDSPYFWGDICLKRVRYMRNFSYAGINTLKVCPQMPYYDPHRPYVNAWFASSSGGNVARFNQTISERDQDRLFEEGGACIMYAHLAQDFCRNRWIEPRFRVLMKRLSKMNGWFVPVGTLLDHLMLVQGRQAISDRERRRLERRWMWDRIKQRGRG